MTNYITIKDGDVLAGYKEYYLNSLLSMGFWRAVYPALWVDAGGSEVVVDGRTYFGGKLNVDDVSAESEELLRYSGVDDAGVDDIRNAYAQDGVDHVYINFKPKQTYTLDGLKWYFSNVVKKSIESSGVTTFTLSHESTYLYDPSPAQPYSFKSTPMEDFNPSGITPTVFDDEISNVIELIYILTDLFEDFEQVDVIVSDVLQDAASGLYKYTTTYTITLNNLSYFSDSIKIEELYNIIYLGDEIRDYYRSDVLSIDGFEDLNISNNAGVIWKYEYGFDGESGVFAADFTGIDNLVIYKDGYYWIDKELWKHADPALCLLTLGKLIDIGIDKANLSFWNQFVRFIAGFFDAFVNVLGSFIYASAWLSGFWVFDVAENNGLLNKAEHSRQKKTFIKVNGTVAFMIIMWWLGGAGALTKMDIFFYAAEVVALGIDVNNDLTMEEIKKNNEDHIYLTDESEHLSAVYEDSASDVTNLAEYFHANVYDFLDPWTDDVDV